MIESDLKFKCAECKEYGSITKHSRTYTRSYIHGVLIDKAHSTDCVSKSEDIFFLCSLGCLIKFIASEADDGRL